MQPSTHIGQIRRVSPGRLVNASRADRDNTDPLSQSMQLMGAVMSFPRNSEIFGENEPADYVYRVISGSVRTYKILTDGRRQVGGFYLPGDIFGLEFAEEHTFSATPRWWWSSGAQSPRWPIATRRSAASCLP